MLNTMHLVAAETAHGITQQFTLMDVVVINEQLPYRDKRMQVPVRMETIDYGNGQERASYRLPDLKAALRHTFEELKHAVIYLYKGVYEEDLGGRIDSSPGGPHDLTTTPDVLDPEATIPHEWVIYMRTEEHPQYLTFNCWLEPASKWHRINLDPDNPPTVAKLKQHLMDVMWNKQYNMQYSIPSRYLAQIQLSTIDNPNKRLTYQTLLKYDAASFTHNKYLVKITDHNGSLVPAGHQLRSGAEPNTYQGARNGCLPLLYKCVDCGFEYPIATTGGREGYDAAIVPDVYYINVQQGTTAAAGTLAICAN